MKQRITLLLIAGALIVFLGVRYIPSVTETLHRTTPSASPSPTADSLLSPEYHKNLTELLDIVSTQDPHKALQELSRRMQTNEVVFHNCHVMAHAIGRAAYKKYQDFNAALQYQDVLCSNGYLHGLIEARLSSLTSDQAAIEALKTLCAPYAHPDRCWHGTGHGLMFFTDNNVPKALSLCDTYPVASARSRCYEGVFMENFISDPDSHPTIYVNAKQPFQPCLNQAEQYKGACYFYVPIYYLGLHNNDYGAAISWCEGAESDYTDECVRGVGSLAMKYHIDDPLYVDRLCSTASAEDVPSCVDGMMSYYLTFTSSISQATALCPTLNPSHLAACTAAVKRRMSLFQD